MFAMVQARRYCMYSLNEDDDVQYKVSQGSPSRDISRSNLSCID